MEASVLRAGREWQVSGLRGWEAAGSRTRWAGVALARAGLGADGWPCPGAPVTLPYQVYFMRKLWLGVSPGKDVKADTILHYHQVPAGFLRMGVGAPPHVCASAGRWRRKAGEGCLPQPGMSRRLAGGFRSL